MDDEFALRIKLGDQGCEHGCQRRDVIFVTSHGNMNRADGLRHLRSPGRVADYLRVRVLDFLSDILPSVLSFDLLTRSTAKALAKLRFTQNAQYCLREAVNIFVGNQQCGAIVFE